MTDSADDELEARVLVLAPTARDALATRDILAAAGVASVACPTVADVCREAARGAGAAVLTAEAVLGDRDGRLATLLRAQPPWSDLPLIVLTPPGAESPKLLNALEAVGSVTLMKRPVQVSAVVSTVRAALRDRRRQYAVREHLAERARSEEALRASEQSLTRELDAARLLHDVSTRLIGADDPGALYEQVLDAAVVVMRADFASIQEFHPERGQGGELRLLGYRGFPPEAAAFWEWVRPTSGSTCAAALRTGRRVVVADVRACDFMAGTDDLATYLGAGIRAVQTTPLVSRSGPVLGMISTHWRQPLDPSDRDLRRLDVLARQAADLIDRGQVQAALRASEERFRRYFELGLIGMAITSPGNQILEANDEICRILGYGRDELLTKTWAELTHPDDLAADAARLDRVLAGEIDGYVLDKRWVHKDGRVIDATVSVRCVRRTDGVVDYFLALLQDVTDRKRAEQARDHLAAIVESSEDAIIGESLDGTITSWNRGAERLYGYTAAEAVGRPLSILVPPDKPDELPCIIERLRRGEHITHYETVRLRKDGGRVDVSLTISPVRNKDGQIIGASKIARDISARKRVEAALRAGEERLRQVVESAADYAILTLDPLRRVTSWSPGAKATFGYSPYEVLGRPSDLLFTPEDQAAGAPEAEAWDAQRHGRAADERWHVRKDGSRFYASGVLSPLGPAGAMGYVKVLRDLTDRKRMEDELWDARDRLEQRVAERTAELRRAVDALEAEVGRRRDLARRLESAQEDERRRVSRDLHDSAGQLMAGLALAFRAIEASGELPAPAVCRLVEARRITSDLGRELHGLAVRLRPTSLDDIGLEAALSQLVSDWSARSGAQANFHAAGLGPGRLPAEVETAVYRVVQEALTNAAKHAEASVVSVVVTRTVGHLSVVVEDDGAGFDPVGDAPKGRLGLLGMRERVEQVGGTIDVESSPGSGTTAAVQIPLPTEGGGS